MCNLVDLDGRDPIEFLYDYFARRVAAANWLAKARQKRPEYLDEHRKAYDEKNRTAIEALRLGLASIGIDPCAHPTDLSIRFSDGRWFHIPASEIPEDLHRRIVDELGGASGLSVA